MSQQERRLAAIMFTDIVGYSALTQRDEGIALSLLDKHNELIRSVLTKYDGIEVKTIGDSFLVEFTSALSATECAIELQRVLQKYKKNSREEILVRIGIHVGDVIHRGRDVFGDAVNIASRIEPIAQGGRICITDQVYSQVRNKIPLNMRKLEIPQLKNISTPITVYEINPQEATTPKMELAPELDMRRLAVLPFSNISPDPNDGYFADGLTEELTSKLSLLKDLKVIARTSTMKYKGKEKSISEIGRELGAGVVVEGSVRKAGNRIRVTVQVINANNEEHMWASNYDSSFDDIFAVQSEIADKVSLSLPEFALPKAKPSTVGHKDTNNVTAYTCFLRANQLLDEGSDDSTKEALELFRTATEMDSTFARAYVGVGWCYANMGTKSLISFEESTEGVRINALNALGLDQNLAEAHALLSQYAWAMDDFALAEREARKALELNPNLAKVHAGLGRMELTLGYPQSALKSIQTSYSLDPLSGESIRTLGLMLAWWGREKEALELWIQNLKIAPFDVHLAKSEYELSRQNIEKAEVEIRELERLAPNDSRTVFIKTLLLAMKGEKEELARIIEKTRDIFKNGAVYDRNLGYLKYLQGDVDGFFEAMFRSAKSHTLDPFRMRYSPLFENARRDPRYRELMQLTGLDPDLKEPFGLAY